MCKNRIIHQTQSNELRIQGEEYRRGETSKVTEGERKKDWESQSTMLHGIEGVCKLGSRVFLDCMLFVADLNGENGEALQ